MSETAAVAAEGAPSASEGFVGPDGVTYSSKNAYKKSLKAAKDADKPKGQRTERGLKAAVMTQADPDDPLREQYGDLPRIQSQEQSGRKWDQVSSLTPARAGDKVLLRGRLSTSRAAGAKGCFIELRKSGASVQCVLFVKDGAVSKPMVKYATQITRESVVDVEGEVSTPEEPVKGCSQAEVEIQVSSIKVVSRAALLPFELVDAARPEHDIIAAAQAGEVLPSVSRDTRLNSRFLDLRTTCNRALFRLQSGVCTLYREHLLSEGFTEIHTPKLIGGASEGGAEVFRLTYFGSPACLAQSPQLYKQMAMCGDLERVFEIGPVFRAESSDTHRHLCEFTGLDFEMEIMEHYNEVLDQVESLFGYIFQGLTGRMAQELAQVGVQYPFEPFLFNPVRITFKEGVQMLLDSGVQVEQPDCDITTPEEKALGALVKAKYNTDFYIMTRYPLAARPFYTMPAVDDPTVSNSYDVFMRGEEIISGAQRVHDPDLLLERAKEKDIPVETIQSYVEAFKLGTAPHGGVGVGLERVVMLYCGLRNIRLTSMFPRDPTRLTP